MIHRFRSSVLRRATALLLALCFGLFQVEANVADVHDGDATEQELVSHGRGVSDAHVASHDGPAALVSLEHTEQVPPDGSTPTQKHPAHVCHCVHAHAGWAPPSAVDASPSLIDHAPAPGEAEYHLVSADLQRQLRPPIA